MQSSVPFALLFAAEWREGLLCWLAFSAGAILLERATGPRPAPPPALYHEDQEDDHELLRQLETTVPSGPGESAGADR